METLQIKGTILTPSLGDAYVAALKRNSYLSILRAASIVQPADVADITPVLAYAAAQTSPTQVAVKGGGAHSSTWASSDGGIVIDLFKLNKVALSEDKNSISVQGGALWEDVYKITSQAKVEVVGAPLWFVGVGGFTLGGGYGPLSGEHGLAIDNLLSATVVLADGRVVKTSATEEPDLFWAIRGGGGQFGIVVEFVFKVHPYAGPFTGGLLVYPIADKSDLRKVIDEWKKTQTSAERFTMHFSRPPPDFKPCVIIFPSTLHDVDGARARRSFAPFLELSAGRAQLPFRTVPDFHAVSHAADKALEHAPRRLVIRGTMFSDFYPELLGAVWDKWVDFTEGNPDVRASAVLWDLTVPDRIADIKPGETALKTRMPHYWIAIQGRSTTDESVDACREFTSDVVQFVRAKNAELSGQDLGWFLNMCQGDEKPEDVFGENLPRLRAVKATYDPGDVFNKGVSIEPLV
ncbi:FAD-binding domain-containing protein [Lentinus tigrinus ALCF2SS1-7]|uniref:FAD-binding domain-containing protein n=1 Tax=Lentinus tigrinus ALCF2SS1-6 TaxID=1328759 RepID=A0A5C2RV42_9APHY|nr:FAD-binding domain-containing protein [Lentinus tigrinus ALCF2SS1-6]RPD72560.1 FAD-binding domain-containing protein [Lentinus tigrinus ALCF2SS1-7]